MRLVMKSKMTFTGLCHAIRQYRDKSVVIEEIRMGPEMEEKWRSMMFGPVKKVTSLMGIPVLIDRNVPPDMMYLGPKIPVETEIEVEGRWDQHVE